MNNVSLVGRLTKDPEITISKGSGIKVARFTLAVYRTKEITDFIPVVAFDKQADFVEKYFKKGNRVGVVGSINVDSYKDKDGNNRYSTKVLARSTEFCESRSDGEKSGNGDHWIKTDGETAPWDR